MTSDVEGAMEGVVVTAAKDGSIVSVSVTTDARAGGTLFPITNWSGQVQDHDPRSGLRISVPTRADVVAEKTATADVN